MVQTVQSQRQLFKIVGKLAALSGSTLTSDVERTYNQDGGIDCLQHLC